jgi:miniconductance mechanosensitive channel
MAYQEEINRIFHDWLSRWGFEGDTLIFLKTALLAGIMTAGVWIINKVAFFLINRVLTSLVKKTKTSYDDILIERNVTKYLGYILPALFIVACLPVVFSGWPVIISVLEKAVDIYLFLLVAMMIQAVLRATRDHLLKKEEFRSKPIGSVTQLINILSWTIVIITIVASILNSDIGKLFAALGAASAILLLIFKDSILGFVGSIQLSYNDMVRVGDWISMEKFGADGSVIEINLNTVKVRNWDLTITTIPTYALVSDSFKNWRGMQEGGGRRIKRAMLIRQNSIRFLDAETIERLKKIQLITDYLAQRQQNIDKHNEAAAADKSLIINGRNLTNIGVFRKYLEEYISQHPAINKELTFMTRQLAPTPDGIPLEIYAFSSDRRWVNYEHIMSDIFDHCLAAVRFFDLEIFESPSSSDLQRFLERLPLNPELARPAETPPPQH